jgi:hypothetical protein
MLCCGHSNITYSHAVPTAFHSAFALHARKAGCLPIAVDREVKRLQNGDASTLLFQRGCYISNCDNQIVVVIEFWIYM